MTEPIRPSSDDVTRAHQPELTRSAADDDATLPPSSRRSEQPPPARLTKARERVYEMEGEVARGGMGAVLRARDLNIKRTVAMKVALEHALADEDLVRRFTQEAELTGQLEHPNIVPIYDLSFDEQSRPFYTMKFVKGVTLQGILGKLKEGDPTSVAHYSLAHLLTIFQKVCDAVGFAHSKGVIHRDLKPANIMVGEYGEVLVMDWGLAKRIGWEAGKDGSMEADGQPSEPPPPASASLPTFQSSSLPPSPALTLAGTVMGSPQYMAPEQAAGKLDELDARTDIFALGGMLYHLLTLHPPVSGDSIEEMLEKIRTGAIVPPSSYNAKTGRKQAGTIRVGAKTFPRPPLIPLRHCPGGRIPESLGAVAMKALALKRDDRYQTVRALQQDIEAYQGGFATTAERAGTLKLVWLLVKRHKVEAAAAVVIVCLVAGFMGKVIASERKATAALHRLRATAPEFYDKAVSFAEHRQFKAALDKVSEAILLAPDQAQYHRFKGNLLETLVRLDEARDAYAEALALDKNDRAAAENLTLCEKLLKQNRGRETLLPGSLLELQSALQQQGRYTESFALMQAFGTNKQALYAKCQAVLQQAGWWPYLQRPPNGLFQYEGGELGLRLNDAPIDDLSPLKGLPFATLWLPQTKVHDLEPLRGMPLAVLQIGGTKVKDIGQLQGMPLKELGLAATVISDIRVLKGMHLERLDIAGSKIADLSPLQGMPLTSLTANQCPVTDLGPLRGMPLIRLELNGDSKLADLSPLRGMPLEILALGRRGVQDLSALAGLPLKELDLAGNHLWDIRPLTGMPLRVLSLKGTYVADIRVLRGMPLTRLDLSQCSHLADLTPLKGMPLTALNITGMSVTDLRPLTGMPLTSLVITSMSVTDLGPLQGMPLTSLNIAGTSVTDLGPLQGMPLTSLNIAGTSVTDLGPLQGMPLTSLNIAGTSVTDLRPLQGMHLIELWSGGTRIADLSVLQGMPLTGLDITSTPVTNLGPLQGMRLTGLACGGTRIADLSVLRGLPLERLYLQNCPGVTDLNPLRGMPLKELILSGCKQVQDLTPLLDCPQLQRLTIPDTCKNIECLRKHPALQRLGYNLPKAASTSLGVELLPTVAEFWKEYDTQQAGAIDRKPTP